MSGQAHEGLIPMRGIVLGLFEARNPESLTDIEDLVEWTYKARIRSLAEAFQRRERLRKMRLLQRAVCKHPTGANELNIIYQA